MTVEKAIEILSDVGDINRCCAEDAEALDMAIKALEQQPCEDCISRQAVDEYITHLLSGYLYDEERTRLEELTTYIWELPSVQPTRPTGKWIKMPLIEAGQTYSHECSLCGRRILITDVGLSEFPYCHCGARMAESEE